MIFKLLSRWKQEDTGVAAVESALIFPVMLVLFMGIFDVGNAILANQKAIRSSQVIADLIARNNIVTADDISEAVEAGRLAFEPLDSTSFGVDIASIGFDENSNSTIVWRETVNMTALPDVIASADTIASPDEGVVIVSIKYDFEPLFAGFVIDQFTMNEIAFSRGRKTAVVERQ